MRRGFKSELVKDDEGQLLGFNLGADYCAEHEWGIDKLKNSFGVNVDASEKAFFPWWDNIIGNIKKLTLGIDKRAITKCPDLVFGSYTLSMRDYRVKGSKPTKHLIYYIGFKSYYSSSLTKEELFEREIKSGIYSIAENENVWGWWGDSDFLVASTDKRAIESLFKSFQELDMTISVGGGHVFENGGLHLIIKSRIPKELAEEVYQQDLDNFNLKKKAASLGIHKKLEKANKHFFALSPRWKDDSKKEVIFWLNPQEQNSNNSAWVTIKDLEDWIQGRGIIPKNPK